MSVLFYFNKFYLCGNKAMINFKNTICYGVIFTTMFLLSSCIEAPSKGEVLVFVVPTGYSGASVKATEPKSGIKYIINKENNTVTMTCPDSHPYIVSGITSSNPIDTGSVNIGKIDQSIKLPIAVLYIYSDGEIGGASVNKKLLNYTNNFYNASRDTNDLTMNCVADKNAWKIV
jgi:hypothetical protein